MFHLSRRVPVQFWPRHAWVLGLLFCLPIPAQVYLNEILLNPPGTDIPHEYIELRGSPHLLLPEGTFLLVLEGDTNGNPGVLENRFDLSRQRLGGNGYLVLLQKTNSYSIRSGAAPLVNTNSGPGFGDGSSSSINHQGESNEVDLENGSCTFLLIQSTNSPKVGFDFDLDNNGVLDPSETSSWVILDAIGILDNDGLGDIAYGLLNFRRSPLAQALGPTVDIRFTVDYLGRNGNTTGHGPDDWVASASLEGSAPNWLLGDTSDTAPPALADAALDHLGGPNFGAPDLPGLLLLPHSPSFPVSESGETTGFSIALNTNPDGLVTLSLVTDGQIDLSTDNGLNWSPSITLLLSNTTPAPLLVRARDDLAVEPSPFLSPIHVSVADTSDPIQYPLSTYMPDIPVAVADNDLVLLSEVKVNPPGNDDPYEFIELRGIPMAPLTNLLVVTLEGDAGNDPGTVNRVLDLTGHRLGTNGLLLLTAPAHPYEVPPATTLVTSDALGQPGGGLENGSLSILLLTTTQAIEEGDDLDRGDNGIAEGLPADTFLLDAVGWTDGDTNDLVFGGVELVLSDGTPDAATRFSSDNTPLHAPAWYGGNLKGDNGDSLVYIAKSSTANFPPGSALNPGRLNNTAPAIEVDAAFSSVLGDPTNPRLRIRFHDAESLLDGLTFSLASDNPAVLPDANMLPSQILPGLYSVLFQPVGVGYARLRVEVFDGEMTGQVEVLYGASAAGTPDSRFHTGATDASTAIALSPDFMLIGDDETQIIRLYPRLLSGPPLAGFDMEPFLALTDYETGRAREVDIEGSTRVGNLIYWIGSHSHADLGEIRTNRARIFLTDLSESGLDIGLTYLGRYEHLKTDLLVWDISNGHGKGANYYGLASSAADGVLPKEPSGSGFNIEGLTMAPGSTNTAWISFRAPIVPANRRVYTLIVPILNFDVLARSTAPPGAAVIGEPIHLDLQGRGIRSIEGDTNGYLIVSGPPGNIPTPFPPSDFKLYTWSGHPDDPPRQRAADLTGLTPEVIVELPPHPWTEDSRVQLISDNGRTFYYGDDTPGKLLRHPNLKKARSDWITLGSVVRPQPFLTSLQVSNDQAILTWRANPGDTYRLQYSTSLANPDWNDVPGDVLATDVLASLSQSLTNATQRFYQVLLLP